MPHVRARIEAVLGWATVHGHRSGDNPARWRSHLKEALPPPPPTANPMPSLPFEQMPAFMAKLRTVESVPSLALRLVCLTAVRSHDVRGAKRADFDLDAGLWKIPRFSKSGKPHAVPLSDAARALVADALDIAEAFDPGGELLFPGAREIEHGGRRIGQLLSENAMLQVITRLGYGPKRSTGPGDPGRPALMTTHGSRSCFKVWANDATGFADELSEYCLGHAVGDKTWRAYQRSDMLKQRVAIMQAWADFLARIEAPSNVAEISAGKRRKAARG